MRFPLAALALIVLLAAPVAAQDLLDLRVFPCFETGKIDFEGVIGRRAPRDEGTGKRDRLSGAMARMLKSGTVTVSSGAASLDAEITDGGFAGSLAVPSLADFALTVTYGTRKIHEESFRFPARADFIVVSDIDDTILVTQVNSKVKMAVNTFLRDAKNRRAIPGTPELYRSLAAGGSPHGTPHFIYLSSSPAFLSRYLKQFLAENDFPPGTVILKKSLTAGGAGEHTSHKSGWLKRIEKRYPGKPLLLLGDSGEKDPVIYEGFVADAARKSPVLGVIIHEVTRTRDKFDLLEEIAERIRERFKLPLLHWECTDALREKLVERGLLPE